MRRHRWVSLVVALLPVVVAAGACRRAEPPAAPGAPAPASSSPAATGQPGPTAVAPSGGGGSTGWTSNPVRVDRTVSVPPVPLLVDIRSAAHPAEGYDRIVFDFQGALPGYEVRYVSEVRADPSDLPVTVPGRRFLQVTFRPAQAHTEAGAATAAPRTATLDHPMMRGYAIVGDFEAVLSVAVGLDDVVGFRVGELPGRIYLDVAA